MPIIAILPTDAAFAALEPDAQRQAIIGLLENFLDHAAATGRVPDAWEQAAFRYTISCLRLGSLSSAVTEVKRLSMPALMRPHGALPVEKYPASIAGLRSELTGLLAG